MPTQNSMEQENKQADHASKTASGTGEAQVEVEVMSPPGCSSIPTDLPDLVLLLNNVSKRHNVKNLVASAAAFGAAVLVGE
jgi:tRNA G18 (ribose-2'-O)-methylase SpoU